MQRHAWKDAGCDDAGPRDGGVCRSFGARIAVLRAVYQDGDAVMTRPHHAALGQSDEHYTPPEIFEALGCRFDLDPCQPEEGRAFLSVPADRFFTPADDGLVQPWDGYVWLNPPFGGRNGVVPWLEKFAAHRNGIALVNALTSSGWFHQFAPRMDALLFPKGKTKFVRPDGSRGMSPANGVVLMAIGPAANFALARAARRGFGLYSPIWKYPRGERA